MRSLLGFTLVGLVLLGPGCGSCNTDSLLGDDGGTTPFDGSFNQPGDAGNADASQMMPPPMDAGDTPDSAAMTADAGPMEVDAGLEYRDAGCMGCGAWRGTRNLPGPRGRHTATLLQDGKVLIAGGDDDLGAMDTSLLFDPVMETWTPTGNLNDARFSHTATILQDGRVLVVGGTGVGGSGLTALATAELYNPATGVWSHTDSMASQRAYHSATRLQDGKVLVAGGQTDTAYVTALEVYNPATSTFVPAGQLSQPRYVHAAALLQDGKIMVVGGRHIATTLSDVEMFDRVIANPGVDLPHAVWGHSASSLMDGRILVAGGTRSANGEGAAYAWDPAGGAWSGPILMVKNRWAQKDVVLNNGMVLLVGGVSNTNDPTLADCELFNPTGNSFNVAPPMGKGRISHTATLLQDGRVLVTGGTFEFDRLPSAEIYTP